MLDRYQARINLHGETQRDRILHRTKQNLSYQSQQSLSYKDVCINGVADKLVIDSDDNDTSKIIKSLPDSKFTVGDYVQWANTTWIITSADVDDEVYVNGTMEQCNWLLTWQRRDGSIAQYHCIDINSTQYNSGETANKEFILGTSQHMLTLPCNEDTVILDSPQRFFIDKNIINPTCYQVTQNDTVAYNYGNGIVKVTVMQCETNLETDKLVELEDGSKVWIANYIEPVEGKIPDEDDTLTWELKLKTNSTIIRPDGIKKTIIANLYNSDNETVDEVTYEWDIDTVIDDKYLKINTDKNVISLSVSSDCEDYGEKIVVSCNSVYTGHSNTITLQLREAF